MQNETLNEGSQMTSFGMKEVKAQPITEEEAPEYIEVPLERVEKQPEELSSTSIRSSPYPNMSKEDVLRFSDSKVWNLSRKVALMTFWSIWLTFLGTVALLTVKTPRCGTPPSIEWYQKGIFYDVYVRSFYDSDNDGVGDIAGVKQKLPALKEMGVDTVVLSSVLQSRNEKSASASEISGKFDYGYEVENYKKVDTSVGTLEDLTDLVNATHEHGMKLIMDFVPNHSSIDHELFEKFKAASGTEEGWNNYITANKIPNNWKNYYDDSKVAWIETNPPSKYFYNQFLPTQPEFNLRSDAIKEHMEASLLYWLETGVDGFRIVNSDQLMENSDLQDNPPNDFSSTRWHNASIDLLARWQRLVANYDRDTPRVLLTDGDSHHKEFPYRYFRRSCGVGSHIPLNSQLTIIKKDSSTSKHLFEALKNFFSLTPAGAIALWTTGGQGLSRIETRLGEGLARVVSLLKLTLPGPAMVYYGEEIGMPDDEQKENLDKDPLVEIKDELSRFGFRQPMYWNNDSNAGFSEDSSTTPWLLLNPEANYLTQNAQFQKQEEDSLWNFLHQLISFRRSSTSLQYGAIHLGYHDDHLMTYLREYEGDDRLFIVVNLGETESETSDVTQSYDYDIATSATVAFTTNATQGPYFAGSDINLRALEPLPAGYGLLARWRYVRPLK